MARFEHTTNIQRPIEQDFAFLANSENNLKWKLEIMESRRLMDGPTRVSTRWLHVRQVLEIKIKGTSEVVEYELNKELAKISQMDSCPVQAPFSLSLPMAGQDFISR